jgi:hypothetical protein
MPAVHRARHSAAAATRQGLYQFISVVPFQSIIRCASSCSAPFPIGQVATQLYLSITGMNARAIPAAAAIRLIMAGPFLEMKEHRPAPDGANNLIIAPLQR